jgi:hypothetical protein
MTRGDGEGHKLRPVSAGRTASLPQKGGGAGWGSSALIPTRLAPRADLPFSRGGRYAALPRLTALHNATSADEVLLFVMAGLVPAIHVFFADPKTWMPGTRPGMTKEGRIGIRGAPFSVMRA